MDSIQSLLDDIRQRAESQRQALLDAAEKRHNKRMQDSLRDYADECREIDAALGITNALSAPNGSILSADEEAARFG